MAKNIYNTNVMPCNVSINFVAAYITVAEKNYNNPFLGSASASSSQKNENDFMGFLHATAGEGIITFRDKTVTVHAGEIVFIKYNDIVSLTTKDSEWSFFCLWFYATNLNAPFKEVFSLNELDGERKQIEEIIYLLGNNDYYCLCRANGLGQELVCRLLAHIENREKHSAYYREIRKIVFYINQHVAEKISIADLAKQCHICEKHFRTLFEKQVGMSPKQYVNETKLKRACFLLSYTSLTITEISDELSFLAPAYFINSFKRHYGTTPMQFRKNNYLKNSEI